MAVADGTNSRRAISSVSASRPAKGRATISSAASAPPWQDLNRRPEPHGQGLRGLTASGLSRVDTEPAAGEDVDLLFLDTPFTVSERRQGEDRVGAAGSSSVVGRRQ